MAHWVGILNQPERQVYTGKTKEQVVNLIAHGMTNRSRYLISTIKNQLIECREPVAKAIGSEGEEVAKVFSCNCGSLKKHQE